QLDERHRADYERGGREQVTENVRVVTGERPAEPLPGAATEEPEPEPGERDRDRPGEHARHGGQRVRADPLERLLGASLQQARTFAQLRLVTRQRLLTLADSGDVVRQRDVDRMVERLDLRSRTSLVAGEV